MEFKLNIPGRYLTSNLAYYTCFLGLNYHQKCSETLSFLVFSTRLITLVFWVSTIVRGLVKLCLFSRLVLGAMDIGIYLRLESPI